MSNGEPRPPNDDIDLDAIDEPLEDEEESEEPRDYAGEEATALDHEQKKLKLAQFKQDIDERKIYAHRIFKLVVGWLGFVGIMLWFNGFSRFNFHLSNNVLIALITTSTASVIGIFIIVAKYLFPNR